MPSILSSCLIVLKLAMAVNDGLHSMLSNIYSVIENAIDSDQNRPIGVETVNETSSVPAFHRSVSKHSQILDAFNRRRAKTSTHDQTDVLVSNLTPFQEITITNKDVDGRRKRFNDQSRKSRCNTTASIHSSDEWTDEEAFSSEKSLSDISEELESEVNLSRSLVSLESVADESEMQSFVSEKSDQMKECNVDQSQDAESAEDSSFKEHSFGSQCPLPLHQDSLSSAKKQPINIESNSLKPINGEVKLTNEKRKLLTSEAVLRKPKRQYPGNLSDFEYPDFSATTDNNGQKISAKVNSTSATVAAEYSDDRNYFLDESSKLYHELLRKYFWTEKYSVDDFIKDLKKIPSIEIPKSNVQSSNPTSSNENQPAVEDNPIPIKNGSSICHPVPMTSSGLFLSDTRVESSIQQNPEPAVNISSSGQKDSGGTEFGYFSKYKPLSVTKHLTIYGVPIPQKGSNNVGKLNDRKLVDFLASFTPPSKESVDMEIDHEFFDEDNMESSKPFPSDVKNNVPACDELNDSLESEMVSIARFDTLATVLKAVGASEVLNELGDVQFQPLNDSNERIFDSSKLISGTGNSGSTKFSFEDSTAESSKSTSSQNEDMLNLDNFPLADLNTVEKQLKFLDKLSDSYLQSSENQSISLQDKSCISIKNALPDDFEGRNEVMMENIMNAYKRELNLVTQSAGMGLEELPSVLTGNTGLETNFKNFLFLTTESEPDSEDCWKPCSSPQEESTSDKTLDVFGLPVFVQTISSKPGDTKHLGQENESSKFENEDVSTSKCSGDLLDEDISENSFVMEGTSNETSTPIRGEKILDPSWISINLSSESLQDFNDYSKSRNCVAERVNEDAFDGKDSSPTQFVERMEAGDGPARSDVNVKNGATIDAKDWGNLAAQMSKHIEECISILSIGDEDDTRNDPETNTEAGENKIPGVCAGGEIPESGENCVSQVDRGSSREDIHGKDIASDETSSDDNAMSRCAPIQK